MFFLASCLFLVSVLAIIRSFYIFAEFDEQKLVIRSWINTFVFNRRDVIKVSVAEYDGLAMMLPMNHFSKWGGQIVNPIRLDVLVIETSNENIKVNATIMRNKDARETMYILNEQWLGHPISPRRESRKGESSKAASKLEQFGEKY